MGMVVQPGSSQRVSRGSGHCRQDGGLSAQQGWGGVGAGPPFPLHRGEGSLPFLTPQMRTAQDKEPGPTPRVPRHADCSATPLSWLADLVTLERSPERSVAGEGGHCDELKGQQRYLAVSSAGVEGGGGPVLHTVGDQAVETFGEPGRPLFLGLHTLRCHWSKSRLCSGPMHVTPSDLLRSKKPLSEEAFCFPETSSPHQKLISWEVTSASQWSFPRAAYRSCQIDS